MTNHVTNVEPVEWYSILAVVVTVFLCQAVEDRGIRAGKVNCDAHHRLCQEAQVSAYPSVRFYSGTSKTHHAQVNANFNARFLLLDVMFRCLGCISLLLIFMRKFALGTLIVLMRHQKGRLTRISQW